MEHVVFYPSAEGVQAFKRVDSLDAAVNFVEHLRNSENITEFSVHSLERVPVTFRAYYHVELPAEAAEATGHGEDFVAGELPVEAADDDRSSEWIAEAEIVEPPAPEPTSSIDEPAEAAAFADAPPVGEQVDDETAPEPVSGDVIPSGRRSMGFFAR
jgi:hypothetical protein